MSIWRSGSAIRCTPCRNVDADWIGANTTPEPERTEAQAKTLALSDTLIAELDWAELIVIGAPVYNFAIPASLKAWIDLVCRARKTFVYRDGAAVGLLKDKRAVVAYVSGGTPFEGSIDFVSPYLKHVLGFIGIEDVSFVVAERRFMDDKAVPSAEGQIDGLVVSLAPEPAG